MSKWEWKKLKDICEKGSSNIKQSDLKDLTGDYPIFGASGYIQNVDFYQRDRDYIGIIKDGSGVGRTMLLPAFSSVIGTLQYILPKEGNDIKFINYALQNIDFSKSVQGAAIPHIYFKDYGETEILVSPLSEQKRIVKFLDEEFSKIDTLKTNAETNLKNAKELFETTLEKELNPLSRHSERSEESSADLPSGWEWKKIGDFCETSSGGTPLKQHNEYYENGNIPWLRSGEVCQKEIFETEMYITQKGMENSSAKYFPENSVVVAMYGATAGQVGIVRFRTTTNQAVCGIFPNEKYKTEYLYYALLSKKKELVAQAVGGAQPNISQIKIRNLQIPLPPLSVQKEIVARLDKLTENVKRLETNYKQIIANCDELKKSILKKTFEGES